MLEEEKKAAGSGMQKTDPLTLERGRQGKGQVALNGQVKGSEIRKDGKNLDWLRARRLVELLLINLVMMHFGPQPIMFPQI